jgi:acetyltransferase
MNTIPGVSLPTVFTLSNGQPLTIRPIRSNDAALLVEMFHQLSERTQRLRFHAHVGSLSQERIWREAIAFSDLDPACEAALVAVYRDQESEHIVGVARFARATADATEAEVAIVVRDDFQKMGLGTHLLALLASLARSMGIEQFFAWIMTDNTYMLRVIQKVNLPMRREVHAGEIFVTISLPT